MGTMGLESSASQSRSSIRHISLSRSVRLGGLEVGLDPHGHDKGMTGPIGYRPVDDIEQSLELLLDADATTQQPISDVAAASGSHP